MLTNLFFTLIFFRLKLLHKFTIIIEIYEAEKPPRMSSVKWTPRYILPYEIIKNFEQFRSNADPEVIEAGPHL